MRIERRVNFVSAALLVLGVTSAIGCAGYSNSVRPPADFGVSVTTAKNLQVADLSAPHDYEPIDGIEGVPAANAMKQYQESFLPEKAERPPAIFQVANPSGN